MAEFQECFSKFLSISSVEDIRDSVGSFKLKAEDESFYEEIEAPKFVDFTEPHHHCPDDKYWFCLRVGCDQKHEEEMDSETIYKNFVLRVMAARSPNIRLRKALDRHASRSPAKCPMSAPPKPSKPRLFNMAIISSTSKKCEGKKAVVRSLLKTKSSPPVLKTKPVSAKYLTTPRNRVCRPNEFSFRSIQNTKTCKSEEPKSNVVAKALIFRSPRKTVKVKTSVELRTPISKLCEGMSKLEISSHRKCTLGYLSRSSKKVYDTPSARQLSNHKMKERPQGSSLSAQTCKKQVGKSGRYIKSKVKERLEKQHVPTKKSSLGNDHMNSPNKNKTHVVKTELSENVVEVNEVKGATEVDQCVSSEEVTSAVNSDCLLLGGASKGAGNCEDLERNEKLRPEATYAQYMGDNDGTRQQGLDCCGEVMNHLNTNSSEHQQQGIEFMDGKDRENAVASDDKESASNSSEEPKHNREFTDSDDKENAAASDENRMPNKPMKSNGRKLFGLHEKYSQLKREDVQAEKKSFKESSISSVPATKYKKPKPTNPKPFRLRTDERGVLKEANSERKTDPPTSQSETANLSTPTGKLQRKQGSGTQKSSMTVNHKVPKGGLQRSKATAAAASLTSGIKDHPDPKLLSSPLERLEKFRKMNSSLPMNSPIQKPKVNPQGSSPAKMEITSFLIPGQKLDVIHEVSPEVWKSGKPSGNTTPRNDDSSDRAVSHSSSSCGKRSITIAREPNFRSTHVPRSCTKHFSR